MFSLAGWFDAETIVSIANLSIAFLYCLTTEGWNLYFLFCVLPVSYNSHK
jgi:hypothetical protein